MFVIGSKHKFTSYNYQLVEIITVVKLVQYYLDGNRKRNVFSLSFHANLDGVPRVKINTGGV